MVTIPYRGESRPRSAPRRSVQLVGGSDVRTVAPTRDPGLNVPAAAFGGLEAQALGNVGEGLSDLSVVADKFRRAGEATELATVSTEAKRRLKELEFSLQNDTDFAMVNERYKTGAEAIRQDILQNIGSDTVKSAFENSFNNSSLVSEFAVRSAARKRQVQHGVGQLTRDLDTLSGLMAEANSEPGREDIKQKAILSLENAKETGLIGADKQASMELDFLAKAETVRARRDLQANPEQFANDILDPKQYPDLDESRRQVLSEQADRRVDTLQRERIRLAEKAERDHEKAVKDAQEARAGELRVEAMNGNLTEDRLVSELQSRNITTQQFDSALTFVRKENAGADDTNVALDLRLGIQRGEYTAADVMAQKQNLTQQTMTNLLNLADEVARRGSVLARGDVKQEMHRIDQTVGGVRGPLAILDQQSSERVANAIQEAQDRISKGENPREVADDVIARYRQQPASLQTLGKPQFWQGTVSGDKATLNARLADAQRRALAAGLDAPALKRELERLEKFKAVIDAMPDRTTR